MENCFKLSKVVQSYWKLFQAVKRFLRLLTAVQRHIQCQAALTRLLLWTAVSSSTKLSETVQNCFLETDKTVFYIWRLCEGKKLILSFQSSLFNKRTKMKIQIQIWSNVLDSWVKVKFEGWSIFQKSIQYLGWHFNIITHKNLSVASGARRCIWW